MRRCYKRIAAMVVGLGLALYPSTCPAPIIYRPGEGWTYESVGAEGKWQRNRAKDQLDVAKEAFEKRDYRLALKAGRRVVKVWPLSDYAGEAQYLVARCYEERKQDERAFKEYQKALTRYPKSNSYNEILERQSAIAGRFLDGQWFKLWGYVPFFPSMDKTAKLYEDVVKNGPYHPSGPEAQMNIGAAREKQKEYHQAAKAYEKAADRYQDRPEVASEALYKAGLALNKSAKRAEYDQSVAGDAIETFEDFKALYPKNEKVAEADKIVSALKTEQARGAYQTARFYEKYKRWQGAMVYYNEVINSDPNSPYAPKARERIEALKPKAEEVAKRRAEAEERWREERRKAKDAAAPDTRQPIENK